MKNAIWFALFATALSAQTKGPPPPPLLACGPQGDAEIFCASADWMERNLLRRIEVCFPILDHDLAKRVYDEALAIESFGRAISTTS